MSKSEKEQVETIEGLVRQLGEVGIRSNRLTSSETSLLQEAVGKQDIAAIRVMVEVFNLKIQVGDFQHARTLCEKTKTLVASIDNIIKTGHSDETVEMLKNDSVYKNGASLIKTYDTIYQYLINKFLFQLEEAKKQK